MKRSVFTIPQDTAPGRLLPLAVRMLPEIPQFALREAFKKRDVKVNGQRVGMDAMIEAGAEVQIYSRDTQPRAIDIPVVYQDDRLLVVCKPAGVSCEPDAKGGQTLPQLLQAQLNLPSLPLLCHRLDNPTEGLILLAKNEHVQQLLQDAFRSRQIHKTYTCIVRDTPSPAQRVMTDYLIKDAKNAHVRVVNHPSPGARQIITEYTVLQPGRCARLSVRLHTGRTHQIRAHMASIGHPLLGDDLYGDRAFNKECKTRRLMLCSSELRFSLENELSDLNQHVFTCKPTF